MLKHLVNKEVFIQKGTRRFWNCYLCRSLQFVSIYKFKAVRNQGRYVFTQLVDFLPRKNFEWLVKKYEGNKYVKSFTCWNHLMVLLFGQLSYREGLRDLIVTITPFKSAFHHLGFGKNGTYFLFVIQTKLITQASKFS